MKVDPSSYGSARPKLTQDDFDGDFIILTISSVEEVVVDDDEAEDGKRKSLVLNFEETEDKAHWLNVGQIRTLVDTCGDDSEAWVGQKVPVEKHTATFMGKKFPKVQIMAAEEWDETFKKAGVKRAKKPAASTPPKRGSR
jgi:hypothetical protein